MKKAIIIIGLLIIGCVSEKIKEVDYCKVHPDAPECKLPDDPCSLYPDLYFYCINLPPEEFCKKYPEVEICKGVTPNYPPVITLTVSSPCGQYGDVITLDASQSKDPDGDTLTFSWEILSGSGNFVFPLTSVVNFRFSDKEEDVMIRLKANDGRGGESEKTINFISLGDAVFVDKNGNDENSGRFNEPVSSIAMAFNKAYSRGITEIKILEGTYEGGIDIQKGGISIKGGYYRLPDGCIRRDFENYYTVITSPITTSPSYVFKLTSQVAALVSFDGIYLEGASCPVSNCEVFAISANGAYGVEIRNSYIYGGDGPRVRAIYAYAVTTFSLIKSRVYGGNSSTIVNWGSSPPLIPRRGGVILYQVQNVFIDSSVIDAGKSTGSYSSSYQCDFPNQTPPFCPSIVGVYVSDAINCAVYNSLIYGGTGYNSNNSTAPDFVTIGFATNSACEVYHNHFHGGHPVENVQNTNSDGRSGYSIGIYIFTPPSTDMKIINNIIDPGGADVKSEETARYGVYDQQGIAPNYIFKNNNIYSTLPYMPSQLLPVLYFYAPADAKWKDISEVNSSDGPGGNFDGNISVDPVFDLDGIHLSPVSPLIDAGYPGTITEILPEYDIDGDIRPMGNAPDIGPDEVKEVKK